MENNLDDYVSENIRDVFSKASAKQNNDNLAGDIHENCTAENKSKKGVRGRNYHIIIFTKGWNVSLKKICG